MWRPSHYIPLHAEMLLYPFSTTVIATPRIALPLRGVGWMGSIAGLDSYGDNHTSRFEPRTIQPVESHYTDCANQPPLPPGAKPMCSFVYVFTDVMSFRSEFPLSSLVKLWVCYDTRSNWDCTGKIASGLCVLGGLPIRILLRYQLRRIRLFVASIIFTRLIPEQALTNKLIN
jgi:hypothetical protein